MIVNNKLDKAFGPVGTSAGLFLGIAGIVFTILYAWSALSLFVIGAFVGLTNTSAKIDIDNKRVKLSNNIFGCISLGKWVEVNTKMKLGILDSSMIWRAYSRSNRKLDISQKDIRIILYSSTMQQIMPLMKTNTKESAKENLEKLCTQLEIQKV
ncbi:MAG: hypothetical protein JXB49_27530 [Bacteroidales bacterium]|nr:hypothetical protein [Bacteroidales bacterium]